MKPHRIRMAHSLLVNYGLYKKMQVYVRTLPPPRRRSIWLCPHGGSRSDSGQPRC